MKKIFRIVVLMLACVGAYAQADLTRSKISFEIKNMGIKTGGTIDKAQANVQFDPAQLGSSKIEAVAEAASINTDNTMRDNHLKNEDYFDVAKYPKISMTSTSFKKKGSGFVGIFNLTIKDKTKPVEVPFTYTSLSSGHLFKGSFKINRRDFGVGGSSMTMGDDVTINVEAETAK
ncbi:YceI family protein [Mucilaginibacter sp. 21P]|uniref:YceI family protein n=1 Tax=Mucilaginibacter sp. 21P TaxID=2778902 RepID=UPI001C59AB90|nr:YceI family protein [Mucilaginibacter sp. 21P]QXV65847.1 YceI family protein [Mucilaginibacter sp. 21P]